VTARWTGETIAADLRARIQAGEWAPGARFPGWRELAPQYGGQVHAARTAAQVLRDAGWLAPERGRWTTVADPLPAPAAARLSLEERVAALEAWRRKVDDGS
jgi:GntR family transcriptional regulator